MNLHIMHYSANENIHTTGMVKMLDSIDSVNNTVLFLDNNKFDARIVEKVEIEQNIYKLMHNDIKAHLRLANLMDKYERIFLHSFSLDFMMVCIILLLHRKTLKHIYWISYGGDLYEWESAISKNLAGSFKRNLLYSFRSSVGNFVGIFRPDILEYKRIFKSNANTFFAPYIGIQYSDAITGAENLGVSLNQKLAHNDTIRIQVGHQGNRLLHQIEIIDYLSRFKEENIEVFIPLNYGDSAYCKEVKAHAVKAFGEKAIILEDFIPLNEYYNLLTKVDIAIFYSERQIGLGNIYPLMYYGKKIFFKNPSPMYEFFSRQGVQCPFLDLNQEMTFDVFAKEVDVIEEMRFADELLSKDNLIKAWETVLNG